LLATAGFVKEPAGGKPSDGLLHGDGPESSFCSFGCSWGLMFSAEAGRKPLMFSDESARECDKKRAAGVGELGVEMDAHIADVIEAMRQVAAELGLEGTAAEA